MKKGCFKLISMLAAIMAAVSPAVLSCGGGQTESGLPKVAVSIVPEAAFVKEVCGGNFEVVTLIPPGFSPENYEPTTSMMAALEDSVIYFTIGVSAEDTGILPKVSEKVKIIALEDEVTSVYADLSIGELGRDPHIWLSPKRVKIMVSAIARELSALDPGNSETYNKNAEAYLEKLDALDLLISEKFDNLENRSFIVFHPAFGYFADDYNLTMHALEEEGKEATAARMQAVIELAKTQGIKAIFYQSEHDSRQAEAFAEELSGKTIMLEPLSADYIKNLEKMAILISEVME